MNTYNEYIDSVVEPNNMGEVKGTHKYRNHFLLIHFSDKDGDKPNYYKSIIMILITIFLLYCPETPPLTKPLTRTHAHTT